MLQRKDCAKCGVNQADKPLIGLPMIFLCDDCYSKQESLEERIRELEVENKRLRRPKDFPEIICICGSTRFTREMLIKQWEFGKQGKIVLTWHALPSDYAADCHVADLEGVRELIDEIHKRKIDLADKVFVMNIDGYIGESTRSEIEYAEKVGRPVEYLESKP